MKISANCCVNKTTGEWCGFAEEFDSINELCGVYDPENISSKAASHVTAALWSSFMLPFQILVSSRPTAGDCSGGEIFAIISEAYAALNVVGIQVPLLVLDACSPNRSACCDHMTAGFGPTGLNMLYAFDPTHIFKR